MTALDTPVPVLPGAADRNRSSVQRAPTPPRLRTPGQRPAKSFTSDLLATCGLVLFAFAVAAGFARVFSGWEFFDDLAVIAVVGHGSGLVARRLRLPAWATIPIVMLVVFWMVGFIYYRSTYSWGLPTRDTWALFNAEIDLVREQFRVAVAPVIESGGWDVLAAIGLALAVVLADAFAFGALARAEALVPGGVLFVFVAALGDDRLRVALSALLVGAGVVATVLLRAHHAPGGITDSTRGTPRVLIQAAGVAVAVALIAGYVGSRVPGASSEPLLDTRGRGNGDSATLSALVDIRSRLINQRDLEMITVQASGGSYWRMTTLAEFDGNIWSAPDRIAEPDAVAPRSSDVEIRQRMSIVGLAGTQIPAAPDPTNAAKGSTPLPYDKPSSTLSTVDAELSRGDSFDIVSRSPRFDPAVLAAATSLDPGDPIYFDLPDDFPDDAEALAREVTAGAANSYDAALLLQNWFRSEFAYSLEVQQGHSNDAIEGFLRDKVGYCEQFAGTYAAMMRSLGIPARVAVGFTTGKQIGEGTYSVTGRNAHAWPEVWFDGLGWVLFEPTPGRGASGAQSYTGVEAAQDTSTGTQQDGVQPTPDEAAVDPANTAPTTLPPIPAGEGLDVPIPAAPPDSTGTASNGAGNAWIPLALLAAIALAVAAPPIGRRIRRRARRSPSEQLANNWDRAVDALRLVDVPIVASATPTETAIVAVRTFPIVSRPMRSLADTITVATYAEDGAVDLDHVGAYGASTVRDASHWARQIERAVNDSVPKRVRVYRYFTNWK